MPLRRLPSPVSPCLRRLFQSASWRRAGSQNHYETLQIPTNATPAEVKKSFYALSKAHHPDHNPDDPNASQRFIQISDAYATLGTPAKRRAYDHEHSLNRQSHQAHGTPRGSYSSTQTPAGGRPASGLSRRRTQFRGPPPSFYQSGGWGQHTDKRRAAQDHGAAGAKEPKFDANLGGFAGGMGYGQDPAGHGLDNDVPHFNRDGHYRTHENQDKRRQRRRSSGLDYADAEAPTGTMANFLFVSGIISLGVLVPTFLFERITMKSKAENRA